MKILEPVVRESDGGLEVEFHIEEGEPFHIGRVSVKSDRAVPALKTRGGQLFNRSRISEDLGVLQAHFGNDVTVSPRTEIDAERRIVHLTFDVTR